MVIAHVLLPNVNELLFTDRLLPIAQLLVEELAPDLNFCFEPLAKILPDITHITYVPQPQLLILGMVILPVIGILRIGIHKPSVGLMTIPKQGEFSWEFRQSSHMCGNHQQGCTVFLHTKSVFACFWTVLRLLDLLLMLGRGNFRAEISFGDRARFGEQPIGEERFGQHLSN